MSLLNLILNSSNRTIRNDFSLWGFSDSHMTNGITQENLLRQAFADANSLFTFDIAINGGDTFSRGAMSDALGVKIPEVFDTIANGHTINDIYSIMGNHDDTGLDDPEAEANYYFKRYIDSAGQYPATSKIINANRPYVITPLGGTNYASYYITIGNLLLIFLGDRNDGDPPMGENGIESGSTPYDGCVGGGLAQAEWDGFTTLVENNTDKIIFVLSHQSLYETTTRTGYEEFWNAIYGAIDYDATFTYPESNRYAGCLGYIENVLAINTIDTWMSAYGQYIDIWMHGHCHRSIGEVYNGRTRKEDKYGTTFLNICSTQGGQGECLSNLFTINGSTLNSKTYVHDTFSGSAPVGWYAPEEFNLSLKTELGI